MEALAVDTDDGLRDALRHGYGVAPSQSTINRWRNGKRADGPSYEYAIALLDAAGWLKRDGVVPGASPAPGDRLGALAEGVARLARGQEMIAVALGVQLDESAQPPATEEQPRARPKPKRKPA
jgi:hypothetical protein